MIKLDDNLLQEIGLGALPPDDKKKMLAHIYETLEMRVGMELAKQMSDAQLNEFEEFINRNDEAGAMQWLETNFPNYKEVVAAEFEKLKLEVKQVAPQIVASSQQQPAAAPQQNMADPAAVAGQPGQQPFTTQQAYSGYGQPQNGGYQQPAAYSPQGDQGYDRPHPQQPQAPFAPDDNDLAV
ncbi:MAG TPA: DUF5663 domain-containing protein [Candidatus Saccharimonadales bacterium]